MRLFGQTVALPRAVRPQLLIGRNMSARDNRASVIYRTTWIGLAVNVVLSAAKILAGILGRSGAMVADGVHSLSDMFTDIVVLAFTRLSSKPEDDDHNYGHGKYETLATIIISLALLAVGGMILYDSIHDIVLITRGGTLSRPHAVALAAAVLSILAKEILYRYTMRAARRTGSAALQANAWHHRSDALSSAGTTLGIALAFFLGEGWRIADPIAAAAVSLFIFKIAVDLAHSSLGDLLERSLPHEENDRILRIVCNDPHVRSPHRLRTRRIGANISIEVHIRLDGRMSVDESHAITKSIEHDLRERYGAGTIISIHVEPIVAD